jgi:hypothetical protein
MAFTYNTIRQGQNIGMLPNPGLSPLEAFQQRISASNLFSPQEQKDLLRDALKGQFELDTTRAVFEGIHKPYYTLPEIEAFREREARRAQELGKESLREGFKYATLANIPKTIAQSFGNISAMNLLGARQIADTFSNTLANYPTAQFSTPTLQYDKYFS